MKKQLVWAAAIAWLPMMTQAQTWEGEGTLAEPYLISSTSDMQALADEVNSGQTFEGDYFELTTDVSSPMIATDGTTFNGFFDGNNHLITVDITSGGPYIGLFAYTDNAIIRNVVVGGRLNGMDDLGYEGFGAVVGFARNSIIENCHNQAELSCAYKYNGGICGYSENTTIQYCSNSGTIRPLSDNQDRTGGICGLASGGIIIHCTNSASVGGDDGVGGIVGRTEETAQVIGCCNLGTVEGDVFVGGIVGEMYANPTLRLALADVECCYNGGQVKGNEDVGGIVGKAADNWVSLSYSTGLVSATTASLGGICGHAEQIDITSCGYLAGSVAGITDTQEAKAAADLVGEMRQVFDSTYGWESAPALAADGSIVPPVVSPMPGSVSPTGIEPIPTAKVYASEGIIYVETQQPESLTIVSMNGTIVKQTEQSGLQAYPLPEGIYIVCVGDERIKVKN